MDVVTENLDAMANNQPRSLLKIAIEATNERSEQTPPSFLRKALLESAEAEPTPSYEPGIRALNPAGQDALNPAELLGQAWALIGTLVSMWVAIVLLAISQDGGWQLLAIAGGAFGSAAVLIAVVEWQRRKFGGLVPMHDWLLGTSIIMGFLALMWSIRAVWGLVGDDWGINGVPNLMMIPAQASVAIIFAILGARALKSIEAGTTAWFSLAMTPYALAAVGSWRWTLWTPDGFTLEMGVSIIALCIIGMWIGIRSNRWFIFLTSAVAASLIPLMYEFTFDWDRSGNNFTPGEGMILFLPILLAEGWFAASPRLRQDLVQRASVVLVGFVVIYQLIALDDRQLVFAGMKLGSNSSWLSLPIVLWMSMLLAYLPATLDHRTPWMPIGVAFAAGFIPDPSSRVVWPVALAALAYLIANEKTRRWVANSAYIALAIAFLIADWLGVITGTVGLDPTQEFAIGGFGLAIIPAIAILMIGEIGIRTGKLEENAFRVGQLAIVLSNAVIWGTPGVEQAIFAIYVVGSMIASQNRFLALDEKTLVDRLRLTTTMAVASAILVVLAFTRRLGLDGVLLDLGIANASEFQSSIPLGIRPDLVALSIVLYGIGQRTASHVLDIGHLISKTQQHARPNIIWSPEQRVWIRTDPAEETNDWVEKGWGPMARPTLIGTMGLLAASLTIALEHSPSQAWMLLAPINALLVFEVSREGRMTSLSRAVAVWVLFAVAFWPAIAFDSLTAHDDLISRIGFDLIILSGPLVAFALMRRKGVETDSISHGAVTVGGLALLSMLDASGGLLSWTCLALAMWGALRIDLPWLLHAVPIGWIFLTALNGTGNDPLIQVISNLGMVHLAEHAPSWMFGVGMHRITGIAVIASGIAMVAPHQALRPRQDGEKGDELHLERVPGQLIGPVALIGFGVDLFLPSSTGLAFGLVILGTILSIYRGEKIPLLFAAPLGFIAFIELANAAWGNISDDQFISTLFAACGVLGFGIHYAASHQLQGLANLEDSDRMKLTNWNLFFGLIGLTFSGSVFWGIGTLIAAAWATKWVLDNNHRDLATILPLFHAFSLANSLTLMTQNLDVEFLTIAGWILLLEGLIFAIWGSIRPLHEISMQINDARDELMKRFTFAGFGWGVFGSFLLSAQFDSGTPFGLTVVTLGYLNAWYGAQRDEAWRRAANLIGTPIGIFALLSDAPNLIIAALIVILGAMNFLFSFVLYSSMSGRGFQPLHEASVSDNITTESLKEESPIDIPEPVTYEDEYVDPDIGLGGVHSDAGHVPDLGDQDPVKEEIGLLESAAIKTDFGFDMVLPSAVLEQVEQVTTNLAKPGWKPVVRLQIDGSIVIDWVKSPV